MMRMTDPLTAVGLPEGGALCAVSGGLDSMCLLEMTVRQGQKQGRRVAAAHFNHQLRGAEADRDEAFVRDWCAAREIPFFAGRGDVRAFAEKTGAALTVMPGGEHWFHTDEQMRFLDDWIPQIPGITPKNQLNTKRMGILSRH